MKTKRFILTAGVAAAVLLFLKSGTSIPKGAVAVKPFDREKYLGLWYEIARLDFRFEKNLDNTTANYSLRADGKIRVLNRGHNYLTGKWSEAEGRAKPAGDPAEGRLKVSFFGPFYGAYNVIALDSEYKYALVAGKNLNYLWILSRSKTIPDEIREKYLKIAEDIGFKTSDLIWVKHDD